MSLLDRLTPGERIDEQLDDHDARIADNRDDIDAHGERIAVVERETPGVAPPERDSTTVHAADICEAGDDVAAAILAYLAEQERICHEFVLGGDRAHRWDTCIDLRDIQYDHFAVVGEPQAIVDVGPEVSLLARLTGPSHALRNLRVDVSSPATDAGIARVATTEHGAFESIRLVGQRDKYGAGGDRHTLRANAILEGATNVVRNVSFPWGDTPHTDESRAGHAIAFSSESGHVGTNIWEGCSAEGFVDNAFYVAGGSGANLLSGCRTRNIAGTHFRLGARDRAQDCHGIQESSPGGLPWTGLWAERGSPTFEGVSITAAGTCERAGELLRDNSGGATWRDVDVVDRRPIPMSRAIRIDTTGRTDFEGCAFTDRSAADGDYFVYLKGGNTHFEDCVFTIQTQGPRHGILAHTDSINRCTFDSCEFHGQEHVSIALRDDAIDWTVQNCRFKPNGGVAIHGNASEWTWIANRHNGEDAIEGRCTGWIGRGTNHNFAHPGDSGN